MPRGTTQSGSGALGAIALILLGTFIAVGAAELIARGLWEEPSVTPPRPPGPEALAQLPELRGVESLSKPNVRGTNVGVLFETNGAGFRDREYSRRKPDGVFRIVVIGDSVTMGHGVDEADTYASRIEARFAARSRPRVEVLNLGLSGLTLRGAIDRLVHLGLGYDPDLVVYGFTLNDIEGPSYRRFPLPPSRKPKVVARNPSYLLRILIPRWNYLRDFVLPAKGSYIFELDENYFRNPAAWEYFSFQLARLAALAQSRGICADLFIHSAIAYLDHPVRFQRYYEAVAEAARKRGLFVSESLEWFAGKDSGELLVSPWDRHPNAAGHALLAAAFWAGLESLPPRCGVPTEGADTP